MTLWHFASLIAIMLAPFGFSIVASTIAHRRGGALHRQLESFPYTASRVARFFDRDSDTSSFPSTAQRHWDARQISIGEPE